MIRGAVLGGDVSRSRSPAIHRAAFRALHVAGTYEAFSVDERGFDGLVKRLAGEGYDYLNVTIPHKRAAALLATSASPVVRATAAANTLIFKKAGRRLSIRGDNTDGHGLLAALTDLGIRSVRAKRLVMVGAGGAAAGALAALVQAGARVHLVARRPENARALRARLPARRRARVTVAAWTPAALGKALTDAHVLISAVPADAWQTPIARAGLGTLRRNAAVVEMAYGKNTPLGQAVRKRVTRYQDGLPMLVHQAARAIELAVGRKPPPDPLLRAARKQP